MAHSDASSMAYADQIQALANNPTWTEQVKSRELESPSLSYASLKKGINDSANVATAIEPMLIPHTMEINNTCTPQGLESLAILYLANQPVDPYL